MNFTQFQKSKTRAEELSKKFLLGSEKEELFKLLSQLKKVSPLVILLWNKYSSLKDIDHMIIQHVISPNKETYFWINNTSTFKANFKQLEFVRLILMGPSF